LDFVSCRSRFQFIATSSRIQYRVGVPRLRGHARSLRLFAFFEANYYSVPQVSVAF